MSKQIRPFNRHIILTPDSLGVALMCTGVLELYKQHIGNVPLHVIAYHHEFFENLPFINKVHRITKDYNPLENNFFEEYIFDSEYKSMLWNLDSQPHRRPLKKHITQLLGEKIGLDIEPVKPIFSVNKNDMDFATKLVEKIKFENGNKPVIYLGLEGSTKNKMWSALKWSEFALKNSDYFTFISFDNLSDRIPLILKINATKTSIFALLKIVDACITVDSFPLHAASARGIDTKHIFCVLGSSHPDVVSYNDTINIYEKFPELDCQPCGRPYHLFDKDLKGNPWQCEHVNCLEFLDTDILTKKVKETLK